MFIKLLFDYIGINTSAIQFNNWMLEQLKIIEHDFEEYLKEEKYLKQELYSKNGNRLLSIFSNATRNGNNIISLINFNYTNPEFLINYGINSTNIHGDVEFGDIIFGIDEKNYKKDFWIKPVDSKYIFTKTSRKIRSVDYQDNFSLNRHKDQIILIYGHSLNEQDYSYFQSIFDFYNILDSEVVIYVGWSNYNKREKLRANVVDSVIKLLKHYGSSMKNDKGENLLHRLLLEKRLRIIEIPGLDKYKKTKLFNRYDSITDENILNNYNNEIHDLLWPLI